MKTQRSQANTTIFSLVQQCAITQVLPDGMTITTSGNRLVQVIRLVGKDAAGLSSEEQMSDYRLRKGFFDKINPALDIVIHQQKRLFRPQFQKADHGNALIDTVVDLYHEKMEEVYTTTNFIVVSTLLASGPKGLFYGATKKSFAGINQEIENAAALLSEEVKLIASMVNSYEPAILTLSGERENSLLQFWSYLQNGGKEFVIPSKNNYLGKLISLSDISFGEEDKTIVLSDSDGTRYMACLTINDYPAETHSRLFDGIFKIKHPFSIIHYIRPSSAEAAKKLVKNKLSHIQSFSGFTGARYSSLVAVGNAVDNGEISLHHHSLSICVYGKSKEHLETGIREIRAELNKIDIDILREGINLSAAFFSQFPDNIANQEARSVLCTSENIADFVTFSCNNPGHSSCAFGNNPVATFRTPASTLYHFIFHESTASSALGHTMVIGGSGSGKTTLIMDLLIKSMKFRGRDGKSPIRMLLFDSLNGMRIPVTAFGGHYTDMEGRAGMLLNPLLLPDEPGNRDFLEMWLEMLAGGADEQERETIKGAVADLFDLLPEQRKLKDLEASLGLDGLKPTGEMMLLSRLQKWWDMAHANGALFTAMKDTLSASYEKQMVAFDMAAILKNKELLAPLSSYIFHAFTNQIKNNPCPHICFIDEMVQYLDNPQFGPFILKAIREWRKRNGIFIGAVQEAKVLTGSENGMKTLDNIATFLIFPNATADEKDYVGGLGLTDQEFSWVQNTAGHKHRVMVKRRGGGSTIIDVNLSSLGKYLRLYSSDMGDQQKMDKGISHHGAEWAQYYMQA